LNSKSPVFTLKLIRRSIRRIKTSLLYGSLSESPILFANSFPKSGTHLLIQVLKGFSKLGPVVDSGLPAILTFDGRTGEPRNLDGILKDLGRLKSGDIAYGHLYAQSPIMDELTRDGVATAFIYRDPRDVVVSHVHYVTEMAPDHVHHGYYTERLHTFNDRLKVSILGLPGIRVPFPDIRKRFEPYLCWLDTNRVLNLRFEDFITNRMEMLGMVVDYAVSCGFPLESGRDESIKILNAAINPGKSPTYRSGKIGKWRESFTDEHKVIFKEVAGDLLVRLGYERNQDW